MVKQQKPRPAMTDCVMTDCVGGAGSQMGERPFERPGPSPTWAFPTHPSPFLIPSYLLAKKATHGKRRS